MVEVNDGEERHRHEVDLTAKHDGTGVCPGEILLRWCLKEGSGQVLGTSRAENIFNVH